MSIGEVEGCDGRCCAVFTLSEPIVESYEPFVVDMVVPLTLEEAKARAERFNVDSSQVVEQPGWGSYTCRHWDEETRLCTIWEKRPRMCRDYPYDDACHNGCGSCASADIVAGWVMRRQLAKDESQMLVAKGGNRTHKFSEGTLARTKCGLDARGLKLVPEATPGLVGCRRCCA